MGLVGAGATHYLYGQILGSAWGYYGFDFQLRQMSSGILWQWQPTPPLGVYEWVEVFNWFGVTPGVDCHERKEYLLSRGFVPIDTDSIPPAPPPP